MDHHTLVVRDPFLPPLPRDPRPPVCLGFEAGMEYYLNVVRKETIRINWAAYPLYHAPEVFAPFILDGRHLYYVNAFENAASTMETSAVAAENINCPTHTVKIFWPSNCAFI
ncbi:hypothetical protein AAZX31_04G191900 [Glycine max]|uniref:uncharacterized protein n=1 Tax=Glycine max TaxID=3847 RepID=UPI001B356E5E|nr:uncharacterized protein LOC121174798 [Glycine max]KAG4392786.1 hypothetical protein GLYMA_04G210301v4 [Glycine max]KAH1112454.1 hypothetical protein GYH30_010629 [Glycine max]